MISTCVVLSAQVLSAGARPGQAALHMRGALCQTHSRTPALHVASSTSAAGAPALHGPSAGVLLQGAALLRARSGAAGGRGACATLDMGERCGDEGFWVHPSAADAAVHAGAALRARDENGIMVSVAVGYYRAQHALQGA